MSAGPDIVTYKDSPQDFLALLTSGNGALPSPSEFVHETDYRAAEHGKNYLDLSFHVVKDGKLETTTLYQKFNDTLAGFNGAGALIIPQTADKNAIQHAITALADLAAQYGLQQISITDTAETSSPLGEECSARGGMSKPGQRALIDLSKTIETIRADVRKSFKSLINNGLKEISFVTVDTANPDRGLFDDFQKFHVKTAGRVTRPSESWSAQYKMIQSGHAWLTLGYIEPHGLVSSALFTDYGDTSSYAVAVYERSLFDKPLAHANVFQGILAAKERGKKWFNLGVMPSVETASEKELNIAKFKKGFTGNLHSFTDWIVPVHKTNTPGGQR